MATPEQFSKCSWCILDPTKSVQVSSETISPGEPHDQTSYQSELIGIYSQILFANLFCTHHKITPAHMTIACNRCITLECSLIIQLHTRTNPIIYHNTSPPQTGMPLPKHYILPCLTSTQVYQDDHCHVKCWYIHEEMGLHQGQPLPLMFLPCGGCSSLTSMF